MTYLLLIDTIRHITYIHITHTDTRCHCFLKLCLVMLEKKMKGIRINNMVFQEIRSLATLADRVARFVRHCKVIIFIHTRLWEIPSERLFHSIFGRLYSIRRRLVPENRIKNSQGLKKKSCSVQRSVYPHIIHMRIIDQYRRCIVVYTIRELHWRILYPKKRGSSVTCVAHRVTLFYGRLVWRAALLVDWCGCTNKGHIIYRSR